MSVNATRRSTGASVLELVRKAVEAKVGRALDGLSKRELLAQLPNPVDAFEIGRSIQSWADNPVIRAIVQAPTALGVLERWQSIESFGHSSHRTRVVEVSTDGLVLDHVCLDGEPIPPSEDVFIWGLVAGLLELWSRQPVVVEVAGVAVGGEPIPLDADTTRAHVHVVGRPASAEAHTPSSEAVAAQIAATLRVDLLRSWTLAAVARDLGRSPRSLQRALRDEGTSFSRVLQRARVDAALELVAQTDLGLTEIAFCSGFSDHAHLTRTTQKIMDTPPSALRTLLRTVGAVQTEPQSSDE